MARAKKKKDDGILKLLAVSILGVIVFFWLRESETDTQQLSALSNPEIELLTKSEQVRSETKVSPAKQVASRRRSLAQRRQLKMQTLPLQGTSRIPVAVKVRSQWCQVGDLDLMKAALKAKKNARIIMTLEPMVPSQKRKAQLRVVSEAELHQGFSHVFDVGDDTGGFGLFICLDSNRQGSCKQKTAYRINDLGNILFNAQRPKSLDQDPVFYYQMLMTDGESLDIFASNQDGDAYYRNLERFASERIPDGAERRMALTQARRFHQNLSSVPAMVKANGIEISLPYMDPKCLAKSR